MVTITSNIYLWFEVNKYGLFFATESTTTLLEYLKTNNMILSNYNHNWK